MAEASTAAWQDYFLFNTGLALVTLLPALPCWRRPKYDPAAARHPPPGLDQPRGPRCPRPHPAFPCAGRRKVCRLRARVCAMGVASMHTRNAIIAEMTDACRKQDKGDKCG